MKYITAGQLAKLAGTTKRTILWYDRLGIIRPAQISSGGYRYYTETQVLDYQMVLLLATLGVPLKEIGQKGHLRSLFLSKRPQILRQINNLKFNLHSLDKFLANLSQTQTLVNPQIKTLKPFDIYYFDQVGSYVKIGEYCRQLRLMFSHPGRQFTTLAIFGNPTYQPRKSPIKIAAMARPDMKINPKYKDIVKQMTFNPGKVITYTHQGKGELLSLFWKELEKYCRLNNIVVRHDIPDFEIYRRINSDPAKQFFEIYLPIK